MAAPLSNPSGGRRLACVSATIETLIAGLNPDDNAWLYLATPAQREQQYRQLAQLLAAVDGDLSRLPLFGVPFAIKDIDCRRLANQRRLPGVHLSGCGGRHRGRQPARRRSDRPR